MSEQSTSPGSNREVCILLAVVTLAEICALSFRSWIELSLRDAGLYLWTAKNLSYLIVPPILLLLLYPVWAPRLAALKRLFSRAHLTVRIICLALALGLAARLATLGYLVARAGFGLTFGPLIGTPTYLAFTCGPLSLIAIHLVSMSILAPVTEEIINRGWYAQWLRRYGQCAAISGSAALFALLHHPQAIITAFVFGLFLARLYFGTGALWGPVIAHATFNSLIVIDWYCLRVVWVPAEVTPDSLAFGALGAALALVSLGCCLLLVTQKVTRPEPGDLAA